jgi:hypothetical protein
MTLAPITLAAASDIFAEKSTYRGVFNLAIAAKDEEGAVHGVIALVADGHTFELGHIYTDGNAQIGSLLYGGAWRVAKALGYQQIRI